MPRRLGLCCACWLVLAPPVAASPEPTELGAAPLPAVNVTPHQPPSREPSLDAGLLLAGCGIVEKPSGKAARLASVRFCAGLLADAYFGRHSYQSPAGGGYLAVGTAGFRDVRASLGLAGLLPVGGWASLLGRVGPLLVVGPDLAPGAQVAVEIGHRSLAYESHYSLTHALFVSAEVTAPAQHSLNSSLALLVGLRIDGYWLSAPALVFQ